MKLLDANYVLRFILHDNEEMAQQVRKEILSDLVYVPDVVLAEIVFVLSKTYGIDRKIVADSVLKFISIHNVRTQNQEAVRKCLELYSAIALDFVDCLLAAYHVVEGHEICTFDKKLRKVIDRADA